MRYVIGALALLTFFACGKDSLSQEIFEKTDKVVYRFKDSSVPPKYHRSYTITVTESLARVVVDSYGNVLHKGSSSISPSQFQGIVDLVRTNNITNCNMLKPSRCSGGTAEHLKLLHDNNELFKGRVYHCGGRDYGDLCGNVDGVAQGLKSLFPEFDRLVK